MEAVTRKRRSGGAPARFWMGVVALLALKAVLLSRRVYGISGDGHYYVGAAEAWLEDGVFPGRGRSPWFVLALAPGLQLLGREGLPLALTALHLAMDAVVVAILIGHARRRLGSRPLVLAVVVGTFIVQPFTGARATYVLTESSTAFLLFVGTWLLAQGWATGRPRRAAVGAALAAGAALVRQELWPVVLGAVGVVAVLARARRVPRGRASGRAALGALAVALLVAVVPHGLALRAGTPHAIPPHDGFGSWMTTWPATYGEYKRIYWPFPGRMPGIAAIPNRAFDGPEERARVAALLELHRREGASEALRVGFEQLAAERRARSPLRHYALLPLARAVHYWLNPEHFGDYARALGSTGALAGALHGPPALAKALLLALGAAGLGALVSRRSRAALPTFELLLLGAGATLLIGRSLSMAALGAVWSAGLMEPRYVVVVQPFLLALAVAGAERWALGSGAASSAPGEVQAPVG